MCAIWVLFFILVLHFLAMWHQCAGSVMWVRDFRRIRRHLSRDCAVVVANALVSSRLDYCNTLFHSLAAKDLHKL